jgi:hypothetical protein
VAGADNLIVELKNLNCNTQSALLQVQYGNVCILVQVWYGVIARMSLDITYISDYCTVTC